MRKELRLAPCTLPALLASPATWSTRGGSASRRRQCGSRGRDQVADRRGSPVCLPGEAHFRRRNIDDRNRRDFRGDVHRRGDGCGDEADCSPGAYGLDLLFEIAGGWAPLWAPAVGAGVDVVPRVPDGAGAPMQDDGVVRELPNSDFGAPGEF